MVSKKKKRIFNSNFIIIFLALVVIGIIFIISLGTEKKSKIELTEENIGSGFLEVETSPDSAEIYINGESDNSFRYIYMGVMNVLLAGVTAGFADFILMKGLEDKAIVEILAIIGGNMALYIKIQNIIGKVLLHICYYVKQREVVRKMSEEMVVED